jgi:hypothetical protein
VAGEDDSRVSLHPADQYDFLALLSSSASLSVASSLSLSASSSGVSSEFYASLWGTRGLLEFMTLNANAAAAIKSPKNPDTEGTTDYTLPMDSPSIW